MRADPLGVPLGVPDSQTIHIDAFHTYRPGGPEPRTVISPFLGYSAEREAATQRKLYRYWRDKGLDVTSEGSDHLRPDAFVGLQPMSWWDHPEGMAPELYCGSPMHAEEEIRADSENLPGLLDQFCLMVVPWYYRNNTTAAKGDQKMLDPDVGPKRPPRLDRFESAMAEYGNHVFMPALWREKTIVAYSRTGYESRTWELPPDWKEVKAVAVSRITPEGLEKVGELPVRGDTLTLSVKKREALSISPKEVSEPVKRVAGVFTAPPAHFPTNLTTGAAVIGNGDLLAAIGGPAHKLEFRLSKLDFWQASDLGIGEKAASARAIGSLYLAAPQLEGASYRLEQSIHDATVRGSFAKDGAGLSVAAWTPRGENLLVLEITATGSIPIAVEPAIVIQPGHESVVEQGTASEIVWYERRFETPELLWPTAVTVAVRESQCARIVLAPGDTHRLELAVVTNHDAAGHRKAAISMASSLNNPFIAEARRRHTEWWETLWRKCAKVEIGDTYLEDQYYGSHYIMASCCGNKDFPPGLFAWITDDNPCWAGDYHTNYNYQAPWWGVLTSNLLELAEPYDQPVLDYLPRMQEFAKHYLGVRGKMIKRTSLPSKKRKPVTIVNTRWHKIAGF